MKRIFILIPIITSLSLFTNKANAQNTSIGVKAGLLSAQIANHSSNDQMIGFRAGAFITHSIVSDFGVGAEVNYARKGTGSNQNIQLNYLEIPVMAHYFFGKGSFRPKVFLGGYYARLINAKQGEQLLNGYADADYGLLAGLGFHKSIGQSRWLYGDVRYTYGLAEIKPTNQANRDLSLNVGVSFPLGNY